MFLVGFLILHVFTQIKNVPKIFKNAKKCFFHINNVCAA